MRVTLGGPSGAPRYRCPPVEAPKLGTLRRLAPWVVSALALRDRVQVVILAYETGVPNVLDPLGGSYYVEAMTDEVAHLVLHVDGHGGRRVVDR